eukprot:gnl/Hemi2/16390_TR5464_c0_g2_i1.p1 gnl/Hemi2/16390_TR5464_c0_g2~~gnl/Hemi2/16390_TR5464_c0_g2_i1.p1  ORF type:complete len:117 (-),score=1.27 gnl/Hemi2/16390_TR5464_c0_g2_i1:98-448(-)
MTDKVGDTVSTRTNLIKVAAVRIEATQKIASGAAHNLDANIALQRVPSTASTLAKLGRKRGAPGARSLAAKENPVLRVLRHIILNRVVLLRVKKTELEKISPAGDTSSCSPQSPPW